MDIYPILGLLILFSALVLIFILIDSYRKNKKNLKYKENEEDILLKFNNIEKFLTLEEIIDEEKNFLSIFFKTKINEKDNEYITLFEIVLSRNKEFFYAKNGRIYIGKNIVTGIDEFDNFFIDVDGKILTITINFEQFFSNIPYSKGFQQRNFITFVYNKWVEALYSNKHQ